MKTQVKPTRLGLFYRKDNKWHFYHDTSKKCANKFVKTYKNSLKRPVKVFEYSLVLNKEI